MNKIFKYINRTMPQPINLNRTLNEKFLIQKKKVLKQNKLYVVLRPDKDFKAKQLFPNDTVVYLRYDKPEQLKLINSYNLIKL